MDLDAVRSDIERVKEKIKAQHCQTAAFDKKTLSTFFHVFQ